MEESRPKITPELVFDIIKRRRWIILVPLSVMLVIGIVLSIVLPRVYEAKTLILVEGQKVPQNFVQSIVTEDTAHRINTISQQILSRTNLEKIISDFNLFADDHSQNMFIEDKVRNLRERISVDVITDRGRQTEAFTIIFKGNEPEKVMQVANGLATYFIDENLKVRESQAIGTSSFLDSELDTMRSRLEEVEERIKNYRKTNMGELPEQLETNLRILERLQENLTDRQQNLRDARTRLAELKSQAVNREPSVVVIGADGRQNQNTGAASLEDLLQQLKTMQTRYTEKHPDIQRLKRQIADLESAASEDERNNGSEELSRSIPRELRLQMTEVQREISVTEEEISEIRNQIREYQARTENIPKREQELLGLNRDYENIQATYESLLNRKLEADIAVNMERRQKGEQFRVVDPARMPERPIEPDLRKLFIFMVALGIGFGAGISVLLEFAKPTYRSPDEIENEYDLPVLATIPQLLDPKQILCRKWNTVLSIAYTVVVIGLFGIFGAISILGPEIATKAIFQISGG